MVATRIESCHCINSTTLWAAKHGGPGASGGSITATGRNGGNALVGTGNWEAVYDSVQTAWAGGAHLVMSLSSGANELLTVLDATVQHLTYDILPDGTVEIRRGGTSGTVLATSATGVMSLGTFDYWEFKHKIDNTTGTAEVLKNGVSVASFSGDTQNAGTAASTRIRLYHLQSSGNSRWTDIYYGATGAYWGDGRVECRHPTGAGNSAVLTRGGTDSGANWSQVDETVPNGDTDYVTSGTPGDKDTHAHADLVTTSATAVQAVQVNLRAAKDDAGARSIVSVARLSGTEVDGAVHTLATSYGTFTDLRTTKPGGGAWTVSDVNSSEFGYKVNA